MLGQIEDARCRSPFCDRIINVLQIVKGFDQSLPPCDPGIGGILRPICDRIVRIFHLNEPGQPFALVKMNICVDSELLTLRKTSSQTLPGS